jgi:hypothetical protein
MLRRVVVHLCGPCPREAAQLGIISDVRRKRAEKAKESRQTRLIIEMSPHPSPQRKYLE